jgi:hypothetical protein
MHTSISAPASSKAEQHRLKSLDLQALLEKWWITTGLTQTTAPVAKL